MTYDATHLAVIAVVVCAAATIKGALGFGFPLLAIPLLSIVLGPHVAIPLVVFPTLLSNLILVGLAAGVLGGSTGIFSPVLASYLHMLRLEKRPFVFWMTMMFFVGNIAQFVSYLRLGLYGGPVMGTAVLACAPMAVGTWAGLRLQDSLHPETFSRIVLALVFLAALNLLARGLFG